MWISNNPFPEESTSSVDCSRKDINIATKYIMPSRKRNCSTLNKTYKKWLNKNSKKKTGGCGCQQSQPALDSPVGLPGTLFSGGKRRRRSTRRRRRTMKGGDALGPASLTNFDPGFKFTYPVNTHVNDPIAPENVMSVRMQPNMTGGKRKTRSRKMRGGSTDPFIKAYESNTLSSPPLTSLAGATNAANIVTGQANTTMNYSDNIRTGLPFI